MPTNTSRTVPIGHDVGPTEYRHALLRYGDRPSESWAPATGNEHATLATAGAFTTTRTWLPALPNYSAVGVEIIVNVTTAPGGGQTLAAYLDHYSLQTATYVEAESLGTIAGTGAAFFRNREPLPQLWQLRLVPSGAGTWNAGAGYNYCQSRAQSALPAGTNNIGDVDVLTLPALAAGTNNIGDVDVLTLPGVAGDVAHSVADSGNPLKLGAKAIAFGANPTEVDADERTNLYAQRNGVPWVIGGHPNVQSFRATYTSAQTDAAIITVGAGVKIVVTRVLVTLHKATTVNVAVIIGFGATITPTGAGVVASHPGIEAGSGFATGDGSGILGVGAANEDLRITSGVPTTGALDVNISYYTIAEA
jgi:hypothetical protein